MLLHIRKNHMAKDDNSIGLSNLIDIDDVTLDDNLDNESNASIESGEILGGGDSGMVSVTVSVVPTFHTFAILYTYSRCTPYLLLVYSVLTLDVLYTYSRCTPYLLLVYSVLTLDVLYTYSRCTLYLVSMYSILTLGILCTYSRCTLYLLLFYAILTLAIRYLPGSYQDER